MNNNKSINPKKYEICTILKNMQKFKAKSLKFQNEITTNSEKNNMFRDIIVNILCLKDKRIGITTGSNIILFNQHNFTIDMIIPIKALYIFQYLKDGNIIVITIDNKFVILNIKKNKYNILQEFDNKTFNRPKKILELTNNQILSMSASPFLAFFIKKDNKYSSFKTLDLGYGRPEDAKSILEIPGNRIVVFSYKKRAMLVYDINTHKLLLNKYVSYNINDIMSDLIDNKYIFVRTEEGMAVFNVEENFSETVYKNLPSPNVILKMNIYEYLFFCDEEKKIYLMKFQDKKLIIKHQTTLNIAGKFSFEKRVHKIDEKKFVFNITKLDNNNYIIGHLLAICQEI